jgi:hypothetical protein
MIVSLLLYLLVIRSMALSPRQDRLPTSMVNGHGHGSGHATVSFIVTIMMTVMMMPTVVFMETVYCHGVRDI